MRMVTKYWGRNATIMILIFFSEACDTKSLKFCSSYSVVGLELQENNLIKKEGRNDVLVKLPLFI